MGSTDTPLAGVRAIVSGASSGIGEAIARTLIGHGAHVALLARRADRLEALAAELGERAHAHPVDVTDADAVGSVVEQVVADLGGLDVLVNNAGVSKPALAAEAELADWHTVVDVNLTGVLNLTHAAIPHLVRAAAGERGIADLVTISSASGRRVASAEANVYAASKHALSGLGEALRRELGPQHVRVALVEPGFVATDMTADRDFAELGALLPEDVAETVAFMLTRPRRQAVNQILMRAPEQES